MPVIDIFIVFDRKNVNLSSLLKIFSAFIFFFLSTSCSDNLANQKAEVNNTLPTPENCEEYAGEWFSNEFPNIEEENRMICDNKPCLDHNVGGATYKIICKDNKISGEVVLFSPTAHEEPSNITPKKPPVTPDKNFEIKVPIKESRIEKDSLFLAFEENKRGCLVEINVSPKGEFLIGTFENKNCQRPSDLQQMYNKDKINIKIDYDKGGILFVNKESKTAFY